MQRKLFIAYFLVFLLKCSQYLFKIKKLFYKYEIFQLFTEKYSIKYLKLHF